MNASAESIGQNACEHSRLIFLESWRQGEQPTIKNPSGANKSRTLVRSCHFASGGMISSCYENVSFGSPSELSKAGIGGLVIDKPEVHVDWIIGALKHGIPVFCRQPPVLECGKAHRMVEAARKHDCLLAINFICRHAKGMPELREHIRRGELGDIRALDITFRWGRDHAQNSLPEVDGLRSLRFHLVDLVLWLFDYPKVADKEVYSLEGFEFTHEAGGRQERVLGRLGLANGTIVKLAYSKRISSYETVIDMGIYGDCGDGVYRSGNDALFSFIVGPSFVDKLAGSDFEPRDRALNEWLKRLYASPHYDSSIEDYSYIAELLGSEKPSVQDR